MRTPKKMPLVWKTIGMPQGDRIVIASKYADGELLSLHDINHNVFRLDKNGEVVWQVKRDDSIRGPGWWEKLNEHEHEKGLDDLRAPFLYMAVEYEDGTNNNDPATGSPADISVWKRGCKIYLLGSIYQKYLLDPETGVALNIPTGPGRPW